MSQTNHQAIHDTCMRIDTSITVIQGCLRSQDPSWDRLENIAKWMNHITDDMDSLVKHIHPQIVWKFDSVWTRPVTSELASGTWPPLASDLEDGAS